MCHDAAFWTEWSGELGSTTSREFVRVRKAFGGDAVAIMSTLNAAVKGERGKVLRLGRSMIAERKQLN